MTPWKENSSFVTPPEFSWSLGVLNILTARLRVLQTQFAINPHDEWNFFLFLKKEKDNYQE